MNKNMFCAVYFEKNDNYLLAETRTNYLLPINDVKAMCILLNYVLRNSDIPKVDVLDWWKKDDMEEYLEVDIMSDDDRNNNLEDLDE